MFITWCLIIGALLIVIGLSDTWRQEMPFSTSALYLVAGYLLGPEVFDLLQVTLDNDAPLLERLAEVAVLISLFAVGLRLRAPLRSRLWITPVLLATLAMVVTIGLLAGVGLALGFSLGASLLMAAVLAPTDPVLASDVQVEHPRDQDRLRFSLTVEGGLNDGTAFPFVMLALGLLGLHELGPGGLRWWTIDVAWATVGGLAIGAGLGYAVSRFVVYLRAEREQALGMESFLTLGLIAVTYGVALAASTYGFLAVFAAGVAMRQVERATDQDQASAYMAKAVLDFTLDIERLAELTLMLVIGSLVSRSSFDGTSLGVALFLIFIARPLAVMLTTWRLPLSVAQRRLAAWFGIRGIGSMYYLAFAVAHGANTPQTQDVADAVLVTIVLSVLLHGSSATPVMRRYQRARWRRRP